MRHILLCCSLMLWATACSTPDQQFQRLQRDFLENFPRPDDYVIIEKNDTLRLKLPPDAGLAQRMNAVAQQLLAKAKAIPENDLTSENRQSMQIFCNVLEKACRQNEVMALDPAQYAIDVPLQHFNGNDVRYPALLVRFVEEIPAYYARVEQNWQTPEKSQVNTAVQHSVEALRQLLEIRLKAEKLPQGFRERLEKALPAAQHSVKDFIALCRSGLLE